MLKDTIKKMVFVFITSFIYLNIAHASGTHSHQHSSDVEGSSVGKPALEVKASRKIKVTTSDSMRFTFPDDLKLKNGEIITFIITNDGKMPHEFSIGDAKEQKSHQIMMRKNPKMVHNDGNTITVKPGETKTLTWQFKGNGTVVFACNIPGHFESGMYKKIKIKDHKD